MHSAANPSTAISSAPLLTVSNLTVSYAGAAAPIKAVDALNFTISKGETLGIVGESGSGKTQTALALLGLLAETTTVSGEAIYGAQNLLALSQTELNNIRGRAIAMIFQDPMTALNPHLTIGKQMARVLERHQGKSRRESLAEAARMLDAVRIPEAASRLVQYPHEMSGGMRQRIMIATALLCKPDLLIADEPTTALDVTVQAQILQLMKELQGDLGTAILLITHDMGIVAGTCDRVLVMRNGRLRDSGSVDEVFYTSTEPYTRALLAAVPRLDIVRGDRLAVVKDNGAGRPAGDVAPSFAAIAAPTDTPTASADDVVAAKAAPTETVGVSGLSVGAALAATTSTAASSAIAAPVVPVSGSQPEHPDVHALPEQTATSPSRETLLSVDSIRVNFPAASTGWFQPQRVLTAVNNVSFTLHKGETLGVVGESGCGKSSLARGVLRLVKVASGKVCLLGTNVGQLDAAELNRSRKQMQIIFQDPLASLDPRMTVAEIVAEPLRTFYPALSAAERLTKVQTLLEQVGLQAEHVYRYPHEFSGGQCQRIGIARALISEPELIICDEPVSALDVSVQAQIINLLMDLQQTMGLALIFIAHDLAVVRHISHRVMVMYLGRAVEIADRDAIYARPLHPYTQALISAVPIPDPRLERNRNRSLLRGDLPSPLDPPSGCAFRTRCPLADERCVREVPALRFIGQSQVACHHATSLQGRIHGVSL